MANTIKLSFWLHRSKKNLSGLCPLMLRLHFQGRKVDKATGFYIDERGWNDARQRVRGSQHRHINEWLDRTRATANDLFREAVLSPSVNLASLASAFFATPQEEPTLLGFMKEHNEGLRARVGKDYSFSTFEKYEFTYDKIKAFIQSQLKRRDILLKDLTTSFVMDFDAYLRVQDNNQHNTAVKYCLILKRIINVAVLKGLMPTNPFNVYKTVYKDVPQVYLTLQELQKIEKARLIYPKHLLSRDLFLFQCYTGLAYTDLVNLEKEDITTEAGGEQWIIKPRQKSKVVAHIPLMAGALELIEKYKHHSKTKLFPHYSIQKYNQYLSEIGDLVGISKKLSSHVGRRTFGNVALAKGVSLNVISKVFGHANTLITQRIYAVTTQNIISQEMTKWK